MFLIALIIGALGCLFSAMLFFYFIKYRGERIDNAKKFGIFTAVFLVGLIGYVGIYSTGSENTEKTNTYNLVSLQDGTRVSGEGHGSMFYVYASVTENDSYSFYYKLEDGAYKKLSITGNVVIYEDNEENPRVDEYTTRTEHKVPEWVRILFGFGKCEFPEKSYEIYVPTGTIVSELNLDAK